MGMPVARRLGTALVTTNCKVVKRSTHRGRSLPDRWEPMSDVEGPFPRGRRRIVAGSSGGPRSADNMVARPSNIFSLGS
eukprot:2582376-Pyramimonas_sp.AAC.1